MLPRKFKFIVTLFLFVIFLPILTFSQETRKDLEKEVKHLTEKIDKLEETIAQMQKQQSATEIAAETDSSASEASDLEKELAKELGLQEAPSPSSQETQPGISQQTLSSRRSFFQNMNPNISVIGTLAGNASSMEALDRNIDLGLEEGEFSFQAAVDPYAKADFFITFVKEEGAALNPGGGEADEEGEEGGLNPEIEEAFITILNLPFSTQLKAGKFRSKFGKINETHPHAYNFIGVPQVYANFFGAEGIGDEGASISWLLPNGAFFQELTVQVTAGPGENASFTRAENNRLLYLAHLKNFFDLSDNTSLELGFSGLTGPNNAEGDHTNMFAADLTLKWKHLQRNNYKSFEFTNEFLLSNRNSDGEDVTSIGLYSHVRYQIAKRWFIGALFDYSEYPEFSQFNHKAVSGILQFFTTEFQKFEMQYKYNSPNFLDNFSEFKVRAVFVIGAHGAHQY
ncbi:MAG: hypothetical protein ACE5IR_25390 [bacterium]